MPIEPIDLTTAPVSAQLTWALNAHLYAGLCPDSVEGWESRDAGCPACSLTDRALGLTPTPLAVEWHNINAAEAQTVLTVLLAGAHSIPVATDFIRLLEEAAWSRYHAIGRNFLGRAMEAVERLAPAPALQARVANLHSLYLLTTPPTEG